MDSWILDAGCGPGTLCELLKTKGFSNIDGADASQAFVDHANAMGIYKNCEAFYFGCGVDQFPDHYKNKYDCCVASGVFLPNHMPASGMDDIHASLKTGGFFITAMRSNLYVEGEKNGYFDKISDLIEQGKFKLIKTQKFMRGLSDTEEGLF